MSAAYERRCYIVTSPLIGWAYTQNGAVKWKAISRQYLDGIHHNSLWNATVIDPQLPDTCNSKGQRCWISWYIMLRINGWVVNGCNLDRRLRGHQGDCLMIIEWPEGCQSDSCHSGSITLTSQVASISNKEVENCPRLHYSDVIMGTMASHKSPASLLFAQPFIQAQIKENIKAPRH